MACRLMTMCVLGLAAAACDAGAKKPDCGKAVHAIAEIAGPTGRRGLNAKLKNDLITACADDKWSAEAVACIRAARGDRDLRACRRHLTGAQADAFDQVSAALVDDSMGQVMATLEGFAEDMCACRDSACAQRISEKMTAWAEEMSRRAAPPPRLDMDMQKRLTDIGTRMAECMSKAMQVTP